MFKIKTDEFLSHPVQTSVFVALVGLIMFMPLIRPPFILSVILVGGLVYLSMYFGAVFASSSEKP
ncbi:hypothetical protein [Methylomagnum sp.]